MWSEQNENRMSISPDRCPRKEARVVAASRYETDNALWRSGRLYHHQPGQSGQSSRTQEFMEVDEDSHRSGHMSRRQVYLEGKSSTSAAAAAAGPSSYEISETRGQTEWTREWAGAWRSKEGEPSNSNRSFSVYKPKIHYYTPRTPSGSPPSSPTDATERRFSPRNGTRGGSLPRSDKLHQDDTFVTCRRGRTVQVEDRVRLPTHQLDRRSTVNNYADSNDNYSNPTMMTDIHIQMENMGVQNRDVGQANASSRGYRRAIPFPKPTEPDVTFRPSLSCVPDPENYSGARVAVKRKRTRSSRTTSTLTSEQASGMETLESRKAPYASNVQFDLKSDDAVSMPLDELISQASISRPRRSSFLPKQASRRYDRMDWSDHSNHDNDADDDTSEEEKVSRKRYRSENGITRKFLRGPAVVIDGSSVGFDYGENLHFDWKGIQICVEYFVNLKCPDIVVVVPEERVKTKGMSKNEYLMLQLQKNRYLLLSWENHDEALYTIKIAETKNAIIISNDIWKKLKTRPSRFEELNRKLQDRTFGFQFGERPTGTIRFSKNEAGRAVEDAFIGWK